MSLHLIGCHDGQASIRVSGPVGTDVLDRIQNLIHAMDCAGVHRFCVDVTAARAPDLRLVRLLCRADKHTRDHGGGLELSGVGPYTVPRWAELTLSETFTVHAWSRG